MQIPAKFSGSLNIQSANLVHLLNLMQNKICPKYEKYQMEVKEIASRFPPRDLLITY
jgi:hypothetical protein